MTSASALTPALFGKILSAKNFTRKPLYLLFGSEPARVTDAATRLKTLLTEELGEDSYSRYVNLGDGAEEQNANGIVAQLNTISMFCKGKVIWVGPMSPPLKADAQVFVDYATDPNVQSTLILAVVTPKDNKKAVTSFEKSDLAKAFMGNNGCGVRFVKPGKAELAKWAKSRFVKRGVSIESEALNMLLDLSDNDLDKLANEIDKLAAYIGYEGSVEKSDVEDTVSDHRQERIWDAINAVRRRNIRAAIDSMNNLLRYNMPHQVILKTLTSEIMRVWVAVDFRAKGLTLDNFAKNLGGSSFMLGGAWSDSARWNEDLVRRALAAIYDCNMDIMKAQVSQEIALTSMVYKIVR